MFLSIMSIGQKQSELLKCSESVSAPIWRLFDLAGPLTNPFFFNFIKNNFLFWRQLALRLVPLQFMQNIWISFAYHCYNYSNLRLMSSFSLANVDFS